MRRWPPTKGAERCLSPALRWLLLVGAALNVALAWLAKHPYLPPVRQHELPLTIALGLAGIALALWLVRRGK